MSSEPLSLAQRRFQESSAQENVEEKKADRLGNVRLVLAAITLALVLLPLGVRQSWPWWSLIPMGIIFLILGAAHDRVSTRQRRFAAARRFWRGELDRLEEKWRELEDDGSDVAPASFAPEGPTNGDRAAIPMPHRAAVLAGDLDLFGKASLFQLVCRAHTPHGRRTLARGLIEPVKPEFARARQDAVKELAALVDRREALAVAASAEGEGKLSDAALLNWAEHPKPLPAGPTLRAIGILEPALLFITGLTWLITGVPHYFVIAAILQLVTLMAVRKIVSERAEALSTPDRALTRYADLIDAIEAAPFKAPELAALQQRLRVEGKSAGQQIRELHKLVERLEASHNMFWALTFGPALLWDLNIVLRAEKWQLASGKKLRGWFEVIGEIEALASFAAFSWERPDYGFPVFADKAGVFKALALSHPLIDRRRVVANDLELGGPGSVLLLSGSNMSGKSTLLRAVGINVVLAQAGGPVAAKELLLSPVALSTSIRVTDSLARGASHFYAELQRIKSTLDAANQEGSRLLYLLDEMLHGTNSRERYIGAVSVIRWLSQHGAVGIVTTHDLALAKVEDELPGKVTNAHFGDEVVGEKIYFDYKLRQGAVRSTNALRLMRAIGIDIELSAPE